MTLEQATTLSTSDIWTIAIAAYAAVISTFIFGWDAYKWLASGAKIDIVVGTNMILVGGGAKDEKTYISLTAWNVGDRPTTITNLGGMLFESWWRAYVSRRKPKKAFIVANPVGAQRLPHRFDVGDQWMGLVEQTTDLAEESRQGYLFMILYTAGRPRGQRVRVRIKEKGEALK